MGIALATRTAEQTTKNVYAGIITSSPGPTPQATRDEINADVQELTTTAYLVPILAANFFSNFSAFYGNSLIATPGP